MPYIRDQLKAFWLSWHTLWTHQCWSFKEKERHDYSEEKILHGTNREEKNIFTTASARLTGFLIELVLIMCSVRCNSGSYLCVMWYQSRTGFRIYHSEEEGGWDLAPMFFSPDNILAQTVSCSNTPQPPTGRYQPQCSHSAHSAKVTSSHRRTLAYVIT